MNIYVKAGANVMSIVVRGLKKIQTNRVNPLFFSPALSLFRLELGKIIHHKSKTLCVLRWWNIKWNQSVEMRNIGFLYF